MKNCFISFYVVDVAGVQKAPKLHVVENCISTKYNANIELLIV